MMVEVPLILLVAPVLQSLIIYDWAFTEAFHESDIEFAVDEVCCKPVGVEGGVQPEPNVKQETQLLATELQPAPTAVTAKL